MQAFTHLDARAAPLPLANIDTDQIIPKQFLKTVDRKGLGRGLFYDFRYDEHGRERPDFVLNQPAYKGVGVLIAGDNFGCGSSREHAPWALMDFGIWAVISTSFADIFYNNCFHNGLLPVVLTSAEVRQLMDEARGGNHVVSIDLEAQTVTSPSGKVLSFDIDPKRKAKMLRGVDAIGETLAASAAIETFEFRQALAQPWMEGRADRRPHTGGRAGQQQRLRIMARLREFREAVEAMIERYTTETAGARDLPVDDEAYERALRSLVLFPSNQEEAATLLLASKELRKRS